MRGRTNANGGIFLNATTDEFEVATGNSIVAGDFVEYSINSDYVTLNTSFIGEVYNVSLNHYIAIIGNYPTLFTYINGIINIIANYPYTATSIAQIDSTRYAVALSDKIGVLQVSDSAITLISSINESDANLVYVYGTDIILNYNDTTIKTYKCNNTYTSITNVDTAETSANHSRFFGRTSDRFLTLTISSSGSGATRVDTYTIDNRPINISTGEIGESITTSFIKRENSSASGTTCEAVNDRYIIFTEREYSYSQTYFYATYISAYDVVENRLITQMGALPDRGLSYESSSTRLGTNNRFILVFSQKSFLLLFDTNLMTITILDSSTTLTGSNHILYNFDRINLGDMKENTGYRNVYIGSNTLQIGTPTNTVKRYQGTGNPMGVAKQSGSAGDTIAVYIPSTSY